MYISIDEDQAQVLREILENTLTQLRIESARTDSHGFHELLMKREQIVESLLAKFGTGPHVAA
jgi:hypothetical protein